MRTSEFDFALPAELIAQNPIEPRDRSRLMVVHRASGRRENRTFADLPDLLAPGDVLVRNNTRVVPARLLGKREETGGRWEGLFLRVLPDGAWEILATTRGRPRPGERVMVGNGLGLTLQSKQDARWIVQPESDEPAFALLEKHGAVPLPPYIRKGQESGNDRSSYQTVYAKAPGAVAAPTAGLHFTDAVFTRLAQRSIEWVDVTLHVGIGTFRPIEVEDIEEHVLHKEWGELSDESARVLNAHRETGGRLIAVGTTSARVLETAAEPSRTIRPFQGETGTYIRPGHVFHGLDALITNFHLPRSSLLVLVSALAGVELIRQAYEEAIKEGYRFYSYGDAMLIL